jgi:hypothetical protein
MKKNVHVVIEKEYEIELKDNLLTQESVKEFESYMFELDGDTLEEKQNNLFAYAARQIAEYDTDFVEGLGKAASVRTAPFYEKEGKVVHVVWDDKWSEVETEIVG